MSRRFGSSMLVEELVFPFGAQHEPEEFLEGLKSPQLLEQVKNALLVFLFAHLLPYLLA
jgi:hypothetical protein